MLEPRGKKAVPSALGYDPVNPPEPISDQAIPPRPMSDPSILLALESNPHMELAPDWLRSLEPRGKCQNQATSWNQICPSHCRQVPIRLTSQCRIQSGHFARNGFLSGHPTGADFRSTDAASAGFQSNWPVDAGFQSNRPPVDEFGSNQPSGAKFRSSCPDKPALIV